MAGQSVQETSRRLGVTARDIRRIRRAGFTSKVWCWVLSAAVAVLSFVAGYFFGGGGAICPECTCPDCPPCSPEEGYPYAAAVILPNMLRGRKTGSKIAILLGSCLTFFIAMKASAVFGQAIKYNVYKK